MERLEKDSIDLSKVNVFKLFWKYFIPTLLGMLGMSAVTAIDGICVGHGVGSDGIAAINTETCEALGLDLDTVKEAFKPYCTEIVEVTTAENFS